MNITILNNREVIIDKLYNVGTQNENNATIFNFTFPENLSNANKKIVFITPDGNLWDLITNNSYKITNALTKYKTVSAYVWLVDVSNDIDFRSKIWKITFNDNQEADDVIPTEEEINGFDTMIAQLNNAIAEVDNIDIDATKSGTISTVTITNKEGVEKSVEINDGTDYIITEEDYRNIADIVESEISLDVPTKTSDLTNDSGFIDNTVNNLTNYTLKTNTGSLIDLEINSTTYVVTLSLKDIDGTVISTDTIDLPLESVVVSGRYDNTTKQVILTLENGSEVAFSVADLVAGLQTEITSQNKLASDLVDDSNSGNKFVTTSEKNTWNAKYDKPSGGIPDTDLSSAVQTSLGKADTALQEETYTGTITSVKMNGNTIATSGEADLGTVITEHQDITGKEDKSNKVTSIDENSTNTQYPGAKLVYDELSERDEYIEELEAQIPENTVTGTDITLTDSAEMEIVKFELQRQTEKVQHEGYNLLDLNNLDTFINNGADSQIISTGIKVVTITTADNVNVRYRTLDLSDYAGQQITVTAKIKSSANNKGMILLAQNNSDYSGTLTNITYDETQSTLNGNYKITLSVPNEITDNNKYLWLNLYGRRMSPQGNVGETVDYTELILYTGNLDKPYEPYVGGTASPNPDYPQDVHVVTGDCEIEVEGKNLLNFSSDDYNWSNGTAHTEGTTVILTGTQSISASTRTNTKFDIDIPAGTTVTFSSRIIEGKEFYTSGWILPNIMYYFEDGTTLDESHPFNSPSERDNVKKWTLTLSKNVVAIGARIGASGVISSNTNNSVVIGLQLEFGITATKYEPHQKQTYPITLGNIEMLTVENNTDTIQGTINNWYILNKNAKIASYNGETITTTYISTTGGLDTGATIYYNTTDTLQITDSTLISQLNALYKAKTYKNTTNITTTGADLQPIIELTYKQDLQTLFSNLTSRIELLEN